MKKMSSLFIVSLSTSLIAGCIFDNGGSKNSSPESYIVSGKITDSAGKGIPNVEVVMTGEIITLTDSTGAFSFSKVAKGSYTVTPSLSGYEIEPEKREFTISDHDITGLDFTGTISVVPTGEYNVSGKITDSSNNGISDVTVTLYQGKTFKTTSTGLFIFTKIPDGNYTLTLSKTGYTFNPELREVTVNGANVSGLNFTGTFTGSGGLLAENYFPLRKDSVLNFIRRTVFADNSPESIVEYYDTVTSATTHSGVTYMQVISKDKATDETIKTLELRVADNILWAYIWQPSGKKTPLVFSKFPEKIQVSGLPENPLYDFNKSAGQSWEVYNTTDYETNTDTVLNATFEGIENLSITAGNFNNCVKFKFVLETSNDIEYSNITYYDWIAPGVGRVRTEASMTKNDQQYSSWTDEITGYYIP